MRAGKKWQVMALALAVAVAPLVAGAADPEKVPDNSEFTIGAGNRSDTTTGNLDGSQTFDRRYSVNYDGTCNATSSDSSYDGVSYQVFDIHSPVTENLVAEVSNASFDDSVMFLYCDPFDPANPDQNLVAWDDDGGTGYLSAFTDADGYQIQANTTYHLVVCGYHDYDQGTFTLTLGGQAVFDSGAPTPTPLANRGVPATTPWGATVLLIAISGLAVAMLRRRA